MVLREDAVPVVQPARRVPIALKGRLRQELQRMEKASIIVKVDEPTEWVSPLVVVHKKDGTLRICMDPRAVNRSIKREHYPIPSREDIESELAGAQYFSRLDANSGFHQIPLDEATSRICTFATPFGRYRFLRLPFGISSASEVFQKTLTEMFEGLPGVRVYVDDVLIWDDSKEEHDERVIAVLRRVQEEGLTFNPAKCVFGTTQFVPDRDLLLADLLSRAALPTGGGDQVEDVDVHTTQVVTSIISKATMLRLQKETLEDPLLSRTMKQMEDGMAIDGVLKPYAEELSVVNGVVLKGCKVVVPKSMRAEIPERIHDGHLEYNVDGGIPVWKQRQSSRGRPLPPLEAENVVRIKHGSWSRRAKVVRETAPRSYVVRTEDHGLLRRNRQHLLRKDENFNDKVSPEGNPNPDARPPTKFSDGHRGNITPDNPLGCHQVQPAQPEEDYSATISPHTPGSPLAGLRRSGRQRSEPKRLHYGPSFHQAQQQVIQNKEQQLREQQQHNENEALPSNDRAPPHLGHAPQSFAPVVPAISGASIAAAATDTDVCHVAFKLLSFWAEAPDVCFAQIEAQFSTARITQDQTRYDYVVINPDSRYVAEVHDILVNPPADDGDLHLKKKLTHRLSLSQDEKVRHLLQHEELGDHKPSQLLRYMRDLLGSKPVDDSLLRIIWCQRLPSHAQAILQRAKITRHVTSPLGKFPLPTERCQHAHIDIIGHLPPASPYRYCLTTIDRYSRWPEVWPLERITAEDVASGFFSGWVSRFGTPRRVTTDQARQFESQLFRLLGLSTVFEPSRTTSYHVSTNRMTERFHRHFKAAIMCHHQSTLLKALPAIAIGLRATFKPDFQATPAEFVYGELLRLPGELLSTPTSDVTSSDPADFVTRLRRTMGALRPSRAARHTKPTPFVFKELATCSHAFLRDNTIRAPFQLPYSGPYKVICRDDKTFTLQISGKDVRVSIDRLKPSYILFPGAYRPPHASRNSPTKARNA
ncbi:uncharacterized protein LOC142814443 [Rhipicephalus microplus]|uniref:uncharacterized protein LOC142814443 n=1 Tax=Rhipicephalus microplus TaxID=6941 RepID=UPI003F6CDFC0